MYLVIRISGMIGIPKKIAETLNEMRLRRKYSAVLLEENNSNEKLLNKIRNFVAYGKISEKNIIKLIEERAQKSLKFGKTGKKLDAKKIASEIGNKKYEDLGIKPFFRLHPPRGGIESKKHSGVGKGVLGNNREKINDLLERMI